MRVLFLHRTQRDAVSEANLTEGTEVFFRGINKHINRYYTENFHRRLPKMGPRIRTEEKNDIKKLLRSGISQREVSKRTGRSVGAIATIYKEIKDEREIKINEAEMAAANPEPKYVWDCREERNLCIGIKTTLTIDGQKTGNKYTIDSDSSELLITQAGGAKYKIDFNKIEEYLDELIDISVEVGRLRKKS